MSISRSVARWSIAEEWIHCTHVQSRMAASFPGVRCICMQELPVSTPRRSSRHPSCEQVLKLGGFTDPQRSQVTALLEKTSAVVAEDEVRASRWKLPNGTRSSNPHARRELRA